MSFDRRQLSSSSSAAASHKRPYSQPAAALDESSGPTQASSSRLSSFGLHSDNSERPAKAARLEDNMPLPQKGFPTHPHHHPQAHKPPLGPQRSSGKRRADRHASTTEGPVYTEDYIKQLFPSVMVKQGWIENAKSAIYNWCGTQKIQPQLETFNSPARKQLQRAKLTLEYEGEIIVSYGDDVKRKAAERLAFLHALYLLAERDIFSKKAPEFSPIEVTLTDGTVVDYLRARQFIDYYCRRFGFGKPDFTYESRNAGWEAIMTVGGRRIGLGTAKTKKASTQACYVDVTKYLESCDPDLWQQFKKDASTGKDLGLARPVRLEIDDTLADQIEDLCADIKKSTLYKNRPRLTELMTGDDDPAVMESQPSAPLYVPPSRRRAADTFLAEKSQRLLKKREMYLKDPKTEKMRHTREALPVFSQGEIVLDRIRKNDVTICVAATGSGKTTQIPQLILDEWIERGEGAKCNIMCTQPRRLAAISVANRVAAERGEMVGQSIGYQVRFETQLAERHGSINFCTIGVFLRRMQQDLLDNSGDKLLDEVTHIVVDEVHERDVDTDLLLVVLKRLLADRKARGIPLKVVLMSATLDPSLFQNYFPDMEGRPAPVAEIPGRSYPVEKRFLDEFVTQIAQASPCGTRAILADNKVQDYLSVELPPPTLLSLYEAAGTRPSQRRQPTGSDELDVPHALIALTITHVLRNSREGHVLVFLPGWEDISGVQKALYEMPLDFAFDAKKYAIHCLHSSVPLREQQAIFDPPPQGQRRIILSTNIAETSVTIPDVVYVVDTGRLKEQRYNPDKRISTLVSAPVGRSNLNQRAGRAGRHRPGEYYGLISRAHADSLDTHQMVEMKRVDLSNVVMHVKALNFPGMSVEEVLEATIEPPGSQRVEAAMKSLQMVGALDSHMNLTSLGRVLLQLPLDVQMGRLVLYGCFFRCLEPALTLAVLLAGRDIFLSPMHLKEEALARKNSFTPDTHRSDAIAMLRAYNSWWERQSKGLYLSANNFCIENFLSKPAMMQVQQVKTQLLQILYDVGVIQVCAGGTLLKSDVSRVSRDRLTVPPELNENADSLPVLTALITVASQPNFAVRHGDKVLRTSHDKMVFIHPTSVNNRKRLSLEDVDDEKELVAFAEKRQNVSVARQGSANIYLVNTTRVDPLTYILFGAYHLDVTLKGLECDEWLPVIGNPDAMDDLARLKVLMESAILRVFEGIIEGRTRRSRRSEPIRRDEREDESGDEDENHSELTTTEIQELDLMTRDIVRILSDYDKYRIATAPAHVSVPGTPVGSPGWRPIRLPALGVSRSGYNTPQSGFSRMFHSRPSTPSRLR